MSDYRPIDCSLYDRYEAAIMHRDRLRLRWVDPAGTTHLSTLTPDDLETRDGEEFLLGHTLDGASIRLRLDRIQGFENLDDEAVDVG